MESVENLIWSIADEFVACFDELFEVMLTQEEPGERELSRAKSA
jgi:hypothetical protein